MLTSSLRRMLLWMLSVAAALTVLGLSTQKADAHWQARDIPTNYVPHAVHYPPTYYPWITAFQSYGPSSGYIVDVLNQTLNISLCAAYYSPAAIGLRRHHLCTGSTPITIRRIRVTATATPVPYNIGVYVNDTLSY